MPIAVGRLAIFAFQLLRDQRQDLRIVVSGRRDVLRGRRTLRRARYAPRASDLVAEKENTILEEGGAERVVSRAIERFGEVDPADLRAEARLQRGDVEEFGFAGAVEKSEESSGYP